MRPTRQRLGAVVLVVVTGMALAGCVTLPHSSSVNQDPNIGSNARVNPIRYSPPGPKPGGDPMSIVNGWMQAMLAFPQSPSLVRKFLTTPAGESWNPSKPLSVYADPQLLQGKFAQDTVNLRAQVLGIVKPRGAWVSSPSSPPSAKVLSRKLVLTKAGGEWRISNPPAGIFLDSDTFDRYYHQYAVYYFDPTFQTLVPNPVYELLGSPNHTATALVSTLLQGPKGSMRGVLHSVIPPTTRLDRSVTVSASGFCTVPLTAQVRTLSDVELNELAAQLAWTLRQERLGVKRIQITVDGQPITVPAVHSTRFPAPPNAFSDQYDPSGFNASQDLYALGGGRLYVAPSGQSGLSTADPVQGPLGSLKDVANTAAVAVDGSRAALVVDDRTKVLVGELLTKSKPRDVPSAPSAWLTGAERLLKPSWDSRGVLWLVDRTAQGAVVRVAKNGHVHVVDAPGIAGQDVRAFAVSRDGTRFAAIIGSRKSSRLVIAPIVRHGQPLDVALKSGLVVVNAEFPFIDMTSLAWFSPTAVAVLAQVEGSEPQPYEIAIDGSKVQPTTGFLPAPPVTLTAGADASLAPVIGTDSGRLYIRAPDQQWLPVQTKDEVGLDEPTYPG